MTESVSFYFILIDESLIWFILYLRYWLIRTHINELNASLPKNNPKFYGDISILYAEINFFITIVAPIRLAFGPNSIMSIIFFQNVTFFFPIFSGYIIYKF